jgi:hypothetical protein
MEMRERIDRMMAIFLFFVILTGAFSVVAAGQTVTVPIPIPDTAPPYWVNPKTGKNEGSNPAKDIDVNGDKQKDWLLDREVDEKGNDIELRVIDPDGKVNGKEGDGKPYDEWYALVYSNKTGRYLIGWCPFKGGGNGGSKTREPGPPVQFTGTTWTSRDRFGDDDKDGKNDKWIFEFDVSTNLLTKKHYEDNVQVSSETQEPEGPDEFNSTHWGMPTFNYTEADGIMGPFIAPDGGICVPVDKLDLLAPHISVASTILIATVATSICAKRVKRRKEKQ